MCIDIITKTTPPVFLFIRNDANLCEESVMLIQTLIMNHEPNEKLKNTGRIVLKQLEKHWKSGWFENITKDKKRI
ncbi:hypothetical protein [Spiroplasma endosymbiont of Polydrusus formosus]|uniref:hypothetical protein n=1 Tax=Spiroplasma endosymbiont of Polydrusus formosus TaxID=3139326 RepID=UPI0035B558CD